MKYSKILLVMTVLVCLTFLAFAVSESQTNTMGSSGDYISPNMGQVASSSNQVTSSTNPDEGLTRWRIG